VSAEKVSGDVLIGVDLGGTSVTVGRVSGGFVEDRHDSRITAEGSEEEVLQEVINAIATVFDGEIAGIGCGVPGVVDVDTGVVFDLENIPSWKRVPLQGRLQERFGVPAFVNNDANAFALGEHTFGKGRGYDNMVGITLGTGMGTGVIIRGRLHSGSNCGVGEIGSIPHKGLTVEDFCSGRFFQRIGGESGGSVYGRARSGDEDAIGLFEQFGFEFAHAIMVALYAYDPDAIILGGSISAAFDLFQASMWKGLEAFDYPHVLERLFLAPSELDDAAVLGAAALYLGASNRGV